MLIKSKRQELEGGRNLCRGKDGSRGDEGLPEGAAVGGRLCGTEHFAGEGGEEFLMQSLHSLIVVRVCEQLLRIFIPNTNNSKYKQSKYKTIPNIQNTNHKIF